ATVSASEARGARRISRSVASTGRRDARAISAGAGSSSASGVWSSSVIARAPGGTGRKSVEGSRHSGLPSMEPVWFRRFDWMPADPMIHRLFGRSHRHRNDRYVDAALGFGTKLHVPVGQREQRVVLAEPHVAARMPLGTALAREHVAGEHGFAAEN